jgi:hypothetical protein
MRNQNVANIPLRILKALPVITTSIVEFTKEDPHDKYNGNHANRKNSLHRQSPHHGWTGRRSLATSDGRLDVKLSVPGTPGTNSEQLFAVGWSACFLSAIKIGGQDESQVAS